MQEYNDNYVFLGGKDSVVQMIDLKNNNITEIKGIYELTHCAIIVGEQLIIGGYEHILFINLNTLKFEKRIKHN